MKQVLLIHYGELGLKGENRAIFVKKLKQNIATKLAISSREIQLKNQRLVIPLPRQGSGESYLSQLGQVFGLAWFTRAGVIKANSKALGKIAVQFMKQLQPNESFAVRAKRANKKFPLSSIEVEQQVGRIVANKTGATVNLSHPDKTLFIEIVDDQAYLFWEKHRGLGGLPVGTSGRLLALFSGGIDSPIAAWLMAKRGARVDLLHFSAIVPKQVTQTKIASLHQQLQAYLGKTNFWIVPYVHFQLAVSELPRSFARYEVLLFRRFMLHVAEKLAQQTRVQALVTGDNLSQVASQTLENLVVMDKNRNFPVFRPLLGFDKQEIITLAKKIGTYERSIQSYKDCCSLLHKKPITKGKWAIIEEAEAQLNLTRLVALSLKEKITLN